MRLYASSSQSTAASRYTSRPKGMIRMLRKLGVKLSTPPEPARAHEPDATGKAAGAEKSVVEKSAPDKGAFDKTTFDKTAFDKSSFDHVVPNPFSRTRT